MDQTETKPSLYTAWNHANDERASFLFIDLFFGAAGLWIPLLIGALFPSTSVWKEVEKLFHGAGVYIYCIAFLSASSSYIYLERGKTTLNVAREGYSRYTVFYAVICVALGMFLTGAQLATSADQDIPQQSVQTAPPTSKSAPDSKASSASNQHDQRPGQDVNITNSPGATRLFWVQLAYLFVALLLGIQLFCLRNLEKIPGEADRIKKREQEANLKLLREAQSAGSF